DWTAVQAAAAKESWSAIGGDSSWQFIKIGFGQPGSKIGGLAAMYSGAAAMAQKDTLAGADISSNTFRNWMLPVIRSVPNFTGDPVAAMARGASTMEIGLFPEVQWLLNLSGLLKNEEVRLYYPAYQFVLNFPLARWDDSTVTNEQREAVSLLSNWLSAEAQQASAPTYGLRAVAVEPTDADPLFAAGVPYGIQLTPTFATVVTPPGRSDTLGLIQWVRVNQ
ncbi:MAG: hypothetical protein K8I30_22880, partial [Anaerolineae bacterium]|nr:hypothetical protein [Anaerolineae bacterium]